jgi:hypothetical protein
MEGYVRALVAWLKRSSVAEWWIGLNLEVTTFHDLGWSREMPDREVWKWCQEGQWVLITDNRNNDGIDSLEATLRDSVGPDSLPVVTVSDKESVRKDRHYAEQVALDLLELLSDTRDFDRYRGAGRAFLPLTK